MHYFPACIKGKVPYLMISLLNTVFSSSNNSSHGPSRLGPSMVLFLVFSPHHVEQRKLEVKFPLVSRS
ncbi:hypothetical protein H9L39_01746 [Fusarium oxysporum f. sp. albedinis]|nr:hypothetical protein H9L39_01746 [Fusarium oxysporum f. sp. albedinis]